VLDDADAVGHGAVISVLPRATRASVI
jgi:hypothetical protein